jgi:hypothetical protein
VLSNKKNAEFIIQRRNMLVDIGMVPLEFYLYGEEESDKEYKPQVVDADENEIVEEDQDDVDDGNKKLAAISMEDVLDIDFSQGSTVNTANVTQSTTATTDNVIQSITVSNANVAQSFTATAVNMAQSITATTVNMAQSITATTTVNMAQSTTAVTGNAAHSTSRFDTQFDVELAWLSPQMIVEDTVAREMLDENRNTVWENLLCRLR